MTYLAALMGTLDTKIAEDSAGTVSLASASLLGLSVHEHNRRIIQESATSWERTKFETVVREAIQLYHSGQIQALLFPRVDRETRFVFGSMPLLAEVLQHGLEVFFARERLFLEPNDPEIVERYLNKATQAQAYVETMKTNTMRAKRKLLEQGKLPQGTGAGLYGYDWDRASKNRIIKSDEAMIVKKIFTMIAEGHSFFSVALELNRTGVPSKTVRQWFPLTIKRIVTNPAYCGMTIFNRRKRVKGGIEERPHNEWIALPDVTPALISQDLFDKAQEALKQPRSRPGKALTEYLLRSHIFCPDCGGRMTGSMMSRRYRYYKCSNTVPTATRGKTCNARYVRADVVEEKAWDAVKDTIRESKVMVAALKEQVENDKGKLEQESQNNKNIANIRRELKSYDAQERRLITLFRMGQFNEDTILDELNQLKSDRGASEDKLTELLNTKAVLQRIKQAEITLDEPAG